MKADYNFNRRAAKLVELKGTDVMTGNGSALGVTLALFGSWAPLEVLRIHMTPAEARTLAQSLIDGADRASGY